MHDSRKTLSSYLSGLASSSFLVAGALLFVFFGVGSGCDLIRSSDPPAVPSGVEAISGDAQVEIEWQEVGSADTYNVYRSTSSMEASTVEEGEVGPVESGVSEASYNDTQVENGTLYYYRVTAVGDGGESDPSGEVKASPFSNPPDRP